MKSMIKIVQSRFHSVLRRANNLRNEGAETIIFKIFIFIMASFSFALTSCNDDDDNGGKGGEIYSRDFWNAIKLSTKYENPGISDRSESGTLMIYIQGNNLYYEIEVNNLSSTDNLTMAHFHSGDPLTNGPIILNFNPTFQDGMAMGWIDSVRQSLIDSLKDETKEIYFNVHSEDYPGGLLRTQINSEIIMGADLALTGAEEVPPVETTATGMASLRLTGANMLYSKIAVENLESGDVLTMAHVHAGNLGTNGNVFIPLCASADDFGMIKVSELSDTQVDSLLNVNDYVNAHSEMHPSGLIRAQLVDDGSSGNGGGY